jgi:hypothetical protein
VVFKLKFGKHLTSHTYPGDAIKPGSNSSDLEIIISEDLIKPISSIKYERIYLTLFEATLLPGCKVRQINLYYKPL